MPYLALAARYWKAGLFALLCLALAVQTVRLSAANNRADRIQVNLNEARAELKAISTARNEQAETTRGNVERAEKNEREGKKIADEIREAPIPPDCQTPGLDIMRNEL